LAAPSRGNDREMENDRSGERSETEERVAENRTPSERAPLTRDDSPETDPATGLPRGMHDDDASPLDRGEPLDPFGG
jgi:hypothetical protein